MASNKKGNKDKKKIENKVLLSIVIANIVVLLFVAIVGIIIAVKLTSISNMLNGLDSQQNLGNDDHIELEDFDFKVDTIDYINTKGKVWGSSVFAPFVDVCAWVSDADYSVGGTLDLGKVMQETGIQYFNLGFIQSTSTAVANNTLSWSFGGYDILSETGGTSNAQYQGIKQVMDDIRDNGGDFTISIGGLLEGNFFQMSLDITVLTNTYLQVIDGFNLSRIDLDIEGGAQDYEKNVINAKAIKQVQDLTGVEVVLTLPVLPTGLVSGVGLSVLQAYVEQGVDITAVNIMAMCYGSYYSDYAQGSVQAIDSTMQQIKAEYLKIDTVLSTEQAYQKVGVTTSIGYEGELHPIFTVQDTALVVAHAKEKNISIISFWSLNRDSMTQDNVGIYGKYEHTQVVISHTI